jgi:hypothetical protein
MADPGGRPPGPEPHLRKLENLRKSHREKRSGIRDLQKSRLPPTSPPQQNKILCLNLRTYNAKDRNCGVLLLVFFLLLPLLRYRGKRRKFLEEAGKWVSELETMSAKSDQNQSVSEHKES